MFNNNNFENKKAMRAVFMKDWFQYGSAQKEALAIGTIAYILAALSEPSTTDQNRDYQLRQRQTRDTY